MAIKINGTNTVASPSITGTDTDTGIVYGSDQIDFSTGGSSKVTLNGSNLGIGTTSPSQQLTMASTGDSKINIKGHGSSTGYFVGMSSATDAQVYNAENGFLQFATNDSERMRIDSYGNILFNTTSESNITNGSAAAFQFLGSGNGQSISTTSTGFKYQMRFYNPNGQVGYISTQNSATNFNTSSDYRLKENVTAISDGITRLKTLKPSRFNFKVDKDTTIDGFLAHEVTAVPEAISGTKDEVVTQAMIDAGDYKEGTLNDPIYQGIDQSKLVPLLTAALQEAVAKIEVLETKVAALEVG